MQGIVGQASDFELRGQLSAFCERLSQRSTELSCRRFDEERSRKSKAIDDQRCGTVFCVHISPRTSSTVVRVQVVGVSKVRTLAGMPGLVIALDTTCACQYIWERGWTLKKRLYLKPTVVRSWHRAIAWKRRVTQFSVYKKKLPFVILILDLLLFPPPLLPDLSSHLTYSLLFYLSYMEPVFLYRSLVTLSIFLLLETPSTRV